VAQVAADQVESADAIVLSGHVDLSTAARTGAVLDRLAPGVRRRRVAAGEDVAWMLDERAHRGENARRTVDVHGRLLRGEPLLSRDAGVNWLLFSASWPVHPGRLHDVVPLLLRGTVRARGRIWLAGRPDDVLWLESAGGGLRVERSGRWLAADGADGWTHARPDRRAFASLRWHERFGDRAQDLVALVHDGRAADLAAGLRAALLTRDELRAGPATWRRWPDPFGTVHVDPCAGLHAHLAGTSAPHAVHPPA
jgi:G3E family GTPase